MINGCRSAAITASIFHGYEHGACGIGLQEFIAEIAEQYAGLRDEFYASLEDRKYLSLAEARKRAFVVDWKDEVNKPFKPKVRLVGLVH